MLAISEDLYSSVFGGVEFKVQHYDYSAFGKILSIKDGNGNDVTDAPPINQSFSYTGREYDKESGLFYFRARYLDSEAGRFLQVDPDAGATSRPSSFNSKYIYAENNPIKYRDPSGKRIQLPSAYGNWCGPYDNSGQGDNQGTKDPIDRECKGHDVDYIAAESYQSPYRNDGNFFAPEKAVVAETGHYFYHRFTGDVELVAELSFNSNNWENSRGNFSLWQFTKAQTISAVFIYKNIKLFQDGLTTTDQILFGIDKYKMITGFGKSSWKRLTKWL